MLAAVIGMLCAPEEGVAADEDENKPTVVSKFSYGSSGLQFDDGSGNNFLWIGVRLQTRWSDSEVTQDV